MDDVERTLALVELAPRLHGGNGSLWARSMSKRTQHERAIAWSADLAAGRPLVTEADRVWAGNGVLTDALLCLVAVSRVRRKRVGRVDIEWFGKMRGLSDEDVNDLRIALAGWRR